MNKKSLLSVSIIAGLVLVMVLASLPVGATAQLAYYYNGYNAAPRWNSVGTQTVVQGQTLSVSVAAVDDNGDQLSYSTVQSPAGSSYNAITHVFTFTPNYNQLGSFPVTLGVTDGKSAIAYTTFYVNVTTDYGRYVYGGGDAYGYYNQAPYFTATNSYYAVNSGNNLRFTVTAIDPEGREVRYSVSGLPAGASFDSPTRAFSWTPDSNQRGSYALSFYATDGALTSIPFNVTIVVDGGIASRPVQTYVAPATPTNAQYYYPGTNSQYAIVSDGCFGTASMRKTAIAGELYTHNFGHCSVNGQPVSFTLTMGPVGASITDNLLRWYVPANAVNKEYEFIGTISNRLASANIDFTVTVVGGAPEVTTVVTQPKTIVRYLPAQSTATYYPTPTITVGRTVIPANYQYTADAYGALLPAPAVSINVFNIAVRVNAAKEMIVSWDTNKPTTGEVVFGYSSQTRPSASSGQVVVGEDRTILNYDFTTGQLTQTATRHEANLGKLAVDKTYYLRVISRADNQTEISREIIFIPMTTQQGITIQQSEGAAQASDTLAGFLTSGGFLSFLLLVVIGLIIYLIALSRRPASAEPQFHLVHADHEAHGGHSTTQVL